MNKALPFTHNALAESSERFGDKVRCSVIDAASPPLFVEAIDDRLRSDLTATVNWLRVHRVAFERALLLHGAVVFRGFPIHDTDDFSALISPFEAHRQGYAGGAQRRKGIKGKVMEASPNKADFVIPLHQEMSYLPDNPRIVTFFCKKAADSKGATLIADMRRVTASLPAELLDKISRVGVRYTRNLLAPGTTDQRADPQFNHNDWGVNFGTTDRAEVERHATERGLTTDWQPDGSLNIINTRPGIVNHSVTGDTLYFNQLHAQALCPQVYGQALYDRRLEAYGDLAHPFDASFGDGSRITSTELDLIHGRHQAAAVNFPWRSTDVMFVENRLTAHGRDSFTGTRDVQVAMLD